MAVVFFFVCVAIQISFLKNLRKNYFLNRHCECGLLPKQSSMSPERHCEQSEAI